MAGIDRSDAIKRPTDNTLAARTLERGGEPAVRASANSIESLRQSLPALAVVVEQTVMGSRDKPLYDLVLSLNQQWVRVQSEKAFAPGTVLMVEATPENQLRVLPRVDQAQLNRMMLQSLQFWQAHSLPKIHTTQVPELPSPAVLQTLSADAPELKTLIQWISQKPALTSRAVAQWMQEFSPLARLQPTLPSLPSTSPASGGPPAGGSAATSTASTTALSTPQGPTLAPRIAPLLQAVQQLNPLPLPLPVPQSAAPRQVVSPGSPVLLVPLPAGAPVLPPGPTLPASGQPVPELSLPQPIPGPRTVGVVIAPSPDPATAKPQLIIQLPASAAPLQSAFGAIQPRIVEAATLPHANFPGAGARPGQTEVNVTAQVPAGTSPTGSPQAVSTQALMAQQYTFVSLPAPPDGLPKAGADRPEAMPLEVRLTQWLAVLDSRIRQHPASLHQALAQQAQRLLNTAPPGYAPGVTVQSSAGAGPIPQDDLQPLLQLRSLLEGLQGKTQNNAIQQALGSLAQPDAPAVQQLSIPMIWLGPNHWLNMEWWQEKASGKDYEPESSTQRTFRFRLFFELPPLAPLCADLHWSTEHTDVIFWSQDQSTLGVINRHLDTLEQWTQGLGERELMTRHGMPSKTPTPAPDQFKPLVDVRT